VLPIPSLYLAFPNFNMVAVPLGADPPGIDFQHHRCGAHVVLALKAHTSIQIQFRLPGGYLLIGHMHRAGSRSRLDGAALTTGHSFTVLPKSECDIILGKGTSASIILAYMEGWPDDGGARRGSPWHRSALPWSASHALADVALGELHEDVLGCLRKHGDDQRHDACEQRIQNLVICHGSSNPCVEEQVDCEPVISHRCRYFIFRRTVQFMVDNLHKEIYVSELCEAALVSERTLRYAFEHVVGLSPTRYLFYLRLGSACRDLMLARPNRVSVASIALKRGMWDLSRFAGGYRRVFGEYPSDTLRRRLAEVA